jgi:hypothetical protein
MMWILEFRCSEAGFKLQYPYARMTLPIAVNGFPTQ